MCAPVAGPAELARNESRTSFGVVGRGNIKVRGRVAGDDAHLTSLGGNGVRSSSKTRYVMSIATGVSTTRFGELLRQWRSRRGLSQLALATAAETPARHISFLETGRSRPGADLVLRLAKALDVPLRARNELLTAAGLSAGYTEHRLSDAVMAPYRRAVRFTLDALDPYPAIVIDRTLAIIDTNRAAKRLFALPVNPTATLVDLLFAPGGLRDNLLNFPHVAWAWYDRLVRETTGDAQAESLVLRVKEELRQVPRPTDAGDGLVICPTIRVGEQVLQTVGMSVRFAPGNDVTLQELAIEVLYPRDDAADAFFKSIT